MSTSSNLVSTYWLAARLDDPKLSVIDGSWYLPQMQRNAREEYESAHIPGAVHFPIDEIADTSTDLPHMLPSPDEFADAVGKLGISHEDTIVVYDGFGLFSAPRVWWTFKVMGAKNICILDGGFPKWQSEGHPIEAGTKQPDAGEFTPTPLSGAAVSASDVLRLGAMGDMQIVDMRPGPRFLGKAAEPRPGLRSGHIPGSLNLPFQALVNKNRLHAKPELKAALEKSGFDLSKPVISSCGSGVTAAFLNLALSELGVDALQLYDGSWAEWGAEARLPIETG